MDRNESKFQKIPAKPTAISINGASSFLMLRDIMYNIKKIKILIGMIV